MGASATSLRIVPAAVLLTSSLGNAAKDVAEAHFASSLPRNFGTPLQLQRHSSVQTLTKCWLEGSARFSEGGNALLWPGILATMTCLGDLVTEVGATTIMCSGEHSLLAQQGSSTWLSYAVPLTSTRCCGVVWW